MTPKLELQNSRGRVGRLSYQAKVQSVVVILGHGKIHCQSHTIGKDGKQDDGLEGSGARIKENPCNPCWGLETLKG